MKLSLSMLLPLQMLSIPVTLWFRQTLIFSTNYSFPENQEFYVVFDQGKGIATIKCHDFSLIKIKHLYTTGIAIGIEVCTAESLALILFQLVYDKWNKGSVVL